MIKEAAPEFSMSGSEAEDEREEPKIEGEKDPDFNQVTRPNLLKQQYVTFRNLAT